jgi:hypothetical protein
MNLIKMHSKHRRTPSAMPYQGTNLDYDLTSFGSNLTFDPPQIQVFEIKDKDQKISSKISTNLEKLNNLKLFNNYSILSNNDHCSFLSSSTENLIKEMSQLHGINSEKNNSYEEPSDKTSLELTEGMKEVLKARGLETNRLSGLRKDIKSRLLNLFCQNEVSDIDTERRIDSLRCSGDTVQGPGSTFQMDDFSLVKFETSVEKPEKKTKTVKFKEL